jgi:outer membrane protein TolC
MKNYKNFIGLFLIIVMLYSPVFAQGEQNAVQTEAKKQENNIKTVPHKSILSKIFKKKDNRNIHPVVNETPLYQTNIIYDMDDCIKIALKNSPYIKNLEDTKKIQKHEVNSAKSNYFPVLNAGTGYRYGYTKYSGSGDSFGITSRNGYGLDIGLSEMIFDFGRTIAQINMNKFNYEAAGYDLEDGILNLVFDTKVAYTKVLSERAKVDVLLHNVKINQLNVERTRAMFEVGLKSKIDLVNAEANLTTSEIALLEGQKDYQAALILLNDTMHYRNAPEYSIKPTGIFNFTPNEHIKNEINVAYEKKSYGENDVEMSIKGGSIYSAGIEKTNITDTFQIAPFEYTLQQALDKAFADRHDLKSMKLLKRAAEESLKAVKRSWYPELNVSAGYGLGINAKSVSGDNNVTNSINLYGGLDFPMINGMYIKNRVEIAKINVDKANNNLDLLEANIYFDIQNLYVTMKQLEQQIPLMRKRVSQFRENFELADGRYAVGLGDYLQLQEALTDYNTAQLSFIDSVFKYNLARYELERAMAIAYSN